MKQCKCGTLIRNYRTRCMSCYKKIRKENAKKYFCKKCGKPNTGKGETGLCCKCEDISRRKENFCLDCGKKISLQGKRCVRCAVIESSRYKDITKENNPNWNGGIAYQGYSLSFTRKLKSQIRERDNHICQLCGCTTKENGKLLEVHHIDYDKNNSKEENLISLCKVCHGRMHGQKANRRYWKTKLEGLYATTWNYHTGRVGLYGMLG